MYTLRHIARVWHLSRQKIPAVTITTLLTDSRRLTQPESSLFFALSGTTRDGHSFIPELYKKGLKYFVVSMQMDPSSYPEAIFLQMPDVLEALQKLASHHREQFPIDVIGITGSNGKTIVKEWLYQLLEADRQIVRSPKSYNSQIGVSLSVWQMEKENNLAIFEAGISRKGEMKKLEAIIKPTIGILTNIGAPHSEGFTNHTQKLREKILLFQSASILIANADNPLIKQEILKQRIPAFFWGKDEGCDLQVITVKKRNTFNHITLQYLKSRFEIAIPFTDNASVENALSCCALLLYLKLTPRKIIERIKTIEPVNMRLEFKKGINNTIIINDSYSADLDSLSIALDFLQQQARGHQKTVILSDFLQNGTHLPTVYQAIIGQLQKHKIRRLIGVGPHMQTIAAGIISKNNIPIHYTAYAGTDEFLRHLHEFDFRDETILIKGARVFGFENIVAQLELKVHRTVLEVNLNAILHNYKAFQQMLHPSTKMMVMVKALAYGNGGAELAGLLQYHKADYLAVAYADEGVELRKSGVTAPVMVLNPEEDAFEIITEHHLEPDLFSFNQLSAFEKHVQKSGLQNYPVHIEVETGMNRLGFNIKDMEALGMRLKKNDSIHVQSVFSHLAASDDPAEDAFTLCQYKMLVKAASTLKKGIGYPFLRHIVNSSAIARFPQLQLDMVRLGIGLYGISEKKMQKKLLPALTLKSTIAQIKHLTKGETVSYGRRGVIQKKTTVATIRIGYADGYSRRLGNGVGYMMVKNKKAPVIGLVCMDMVMIDITGIKGVKEGDEVIVFGNDPRIENMAAGMETIPYEVMTGISQRVQRVYWSE